jgi:hypothetical protein
MRSPIVTGFEAVRLAPALGFVAVLLQLDEFEKRSAAPSVRRMSEIAIELSGCVGIRQNYAVRIADPGSAQNLFDCPGL